MSVQNIAIQHFVHGTTRNILAGAGLSYAIQTEKYHHVPLTIIFPSIYCGYHLFKNKETILDLVSNSAMQFKKTAPR